MALLRKLLLIGLFLLAGQARADYCTATLSDVNFGNVTPIQSGNVTASATGNVMCQWTLQTSLGALLYPNVVVCVNAGLGASSTDATNRTMANSAGSTMPYNLYTSTTYSAANLWGGALTPGVPTPITLSATNVLLGATSSAFTVYGQIAAGTGLAGAQTVANANTAFTSSFAGAATINYAFYGLLSSQPSCMSGSSASFSFNVTATAVNNCTITTTPLAFGSNGALVAIVRSTGSLSVRCVNNNAYQIALNGGTVANSVAARKMKNTVTSDLVAYRISATLDGPLWGDGTGGTTPYSGTGNGQTQLVTVYGSVPIQSTPIPGDYKDTVTATIYF